MWEDAVQPLDLVRISELSDDLQSGQAGFLLDLAEQAFLKRLGVVDPAGRHLEHPGVPEDEQLPPARDVGDDAPAYERVDEVAAQAPDLGVGADGNPAAVHRAVVAEVLPRLRER